MKTLIAIILATAAVTLYAGDVRIGQIEVEYLGNARTSELALLRYMDIKTGQEFETVQELEDALSAQTQELKNTRYFSSVEISRTPGVAEDSIDLVVTIEDAWTLLPIPYPIPDTSIGRNGWSFGGEITYDNALGLMQDFYFDGYANFAFGEDRKLKKWKVTPKLKNIKAGGLEFSIELKQEYNTTMDESSDGSIIQTYYTHHSSFIKASTSWNFLQDWRYSIAPEIGLNYAYMFYDDFEGNPAIDNDSVYMDTVNLIVNHGIGNRNVNWIGPLRSGYDVSLSNAVKVLQSEQNLAAAESEMRFVTDLALEGKYYLPIGTFLNYFTRAKGQVVFGDVYGGLGSNLRGVKNSTMSGDLGFFWQNTLAIQLLNLGDFYLQFHPFVDMGVAYERGAGPFSLADELRFGFGADTVFMLGSLDLTVKVGYDILANYFDFTFYTRMSFWEIPLVKKNLIGRIRRDKALYLLLLPLLSYYVIFHYVPMYGVTMAFKDYNIFEGLIGSPWVGFENFRLMFLNDDFLIVLRNTLFLNFTGFLVAFPAPIIVALMLNELRLKWMKRAIQGVMYVPHFLSWVIVAGLVTTLLSPSTGIVNNLITALGGEPVYFMSNRVWWVIVYQIAGVWKNTGWGTIIFLAALSTINPDLYDAAKIDGAGRLQRMRYVTLPGISSTIVVVLLLTLGKLITIAFDRPFLLGNPMVMEVSDVISTYVYRVGLLNIDYAYAAAVGLFQSVVNLIFLLMSNWLSLRVKGEGIL